MCISTNIGAQSEDKCIITSLNPQYNSSTDRSKAVVLMFEFHSVFR